MNGANTHGYQISQLRDLSPEFDQKVMLCGILGILSGSTTQ